MEKHWSVFYKIGAVCAILAFLVMLTEIFLTALPDGAMGEYTSAQVLDLYNRNRFMAMRNMGLINIFATTLALPVYFSLYGLYRENLKVLAAFSMLFFVAGYTIFMADNTSFPLISIADKFRLAASETEKTIILAAAETLLAKGASHTPGTFPGFFLSQVAGILISFVIIKGRILSLVTGIIGLIAFCFLLTFEIISSFFGILSEGIVIIVGIGGVSALTWYVLIALGLFKQSRLRQV